jgi:2-hydroxy-3-keto-5-methylthiopentenyl-1-phosphate phosphatase
LTNKQFKIFIDFDGTITRNDVGEEIFRKFLAEDIVNKIVEDLLTDKISARECWEKLCRSVPAINEKEFDEFIHSQEVDSSLHRFIDYCENNGFQTFVLSDGFDYYIDKILKREKLNHLRF